MSDPRIHERDRLCQEYLSILYHRLCQKKIHTPTGISYTYGEILYESFSRLVSKLKLCNDDVFVDLGSGTGKIPLQVFLSASVKESIGIEIMPELHEQAIAVSHEFYQTLPGFFEEGRKVTFICGDFLTVPWSGTVVFINSICYSQRFLRELGRVFNKMNEVRLVMTLRPIPGLEGLLFKGTERLECTWDSAICYIYEKNA